MRGPTGNSWVGRQPRRYTPPKSGNYTALASANPKSPDDCVSAAPRFAGFWADLFPGVIGPMVFAGGHGRQNGYGMLQPHPLLWTAIENTRMIRFVYHG